jgi:hypothetical protein
LEAGPSGQYPVNRTGEKEMSRVIVLTFGDDKDKLQLESVVAIAGVDVKTCIPNVDVKENGVALTSEPIEGKACKEWFHGICIRW